VDVTSSRLFPVASLGVSRSAVLKLEFLLPCSQLKINSQFQLETVGNSNLT
jgi:hypothetical protein